MNPILVRNETNRNSGSKIPEEILQLIFLRKKEIEFMEHHYLFMYCIESIPYAQCSFIVPALSMKKSRKQNCFISWKSKIHQHNVPGTMFYL